MTGFEDAAARWNGRYAAEGWLFGTAPNDTLAAHAHLEVVRADVDRRVLAAVQLLGQSGVVVEAAGDVVLFS